MYSRPRVWLAGRLSPDAEPIHWKFGVLQPNGTIFVPRENAREEMMSYGAAYSGLRSSSSSFFFLSFFFLSPNWNDFVEPHQ